MNVTVIGGVNNYTPQIMSQNSGAAGSVQNVSPAGGGVSQLNTAGGSSGSSSSTSALYDPRDTNHDGIVSYEEELAYEMKHPLAAESSSQTYNQNGQTASGEALTGNNISTFA